MTHWKNLQVTKPKDPTSYTLHTHTDTSNWVSFHFCASQVRFIGQAREDTHTQIPCVRPRSSSNGLDARCRCPPHRMVTFSLLVAARRARAHNACSFRFYLSQLNSQRHELP